jgi:hypothetical protein
MLSIRRAAASALLATPALRIGASAANASTPPYPYFPQTAVSFPFQDTPPVSFESPSSPTAVGQSSSAGRCRTTTGEDGQGASAGTAAQVCTGAGLTLIGPAIGQIATVIGPTIIGPAVVSNVVVSSGDGSAGRSAVGGIMSLNESPAPLGLHRGRQDIAVPSHHPGRIAGCARGRPRDSRFAPLGARVQAIRAVPFPGRPGA